MAIDMQQQVARGFDDLLPSPHFSLCFPETSELSVVLEFSVISLKSSLSSVITELRIYPLGLFDQGLTL